MKVVVVAHHAREAQAVALADSMGARLVMDRIGQGALWGHAEALRWASEQSERVVVMEDDAEPVEGFAGLAGTWLARFPEELVSFYLGTGRPHQWQRQIRMALDEADFVGRDHITLPQLIHGVCYSVPDPAALLSRLRKGAADFAIGAAWGKPVIYPCASLVDHADGPSVERHPDGQRRTEIRRAWRLAEAA